jgi:hypothetical protein
MVFQLSSSANAAEWVFRVSTALLPFIALSLSYWMVRRDRPDLFVWAVLGICGACLPGQWFVVAEGIIAVQFAWPLYLAIAVGITGRRTVAVAALIPFIFFQHPFAAPILVSAGVVLLVGHWQELLPRTPAWIAWTAILLAAGAIRPAIRTSNDQDALSLGWFKFATETSLKWIPLIALAALFAVGVALARGSQRYWLIVSLVLLSGAGMSIWAADPSRWGAAINYRLPVLFVTAPFVLLMFVCATRGETGAERTRALVIVGVGLMFVTTLSIQAVTWSNLMAEVESATSSGPVCRTTAEVDRGRLTALENWGTSYLAIIQQGPRPRRLILHSEKACAQFETSGVVHLRPWDPTYREPPGYYTYRFIPR